MPLKATRNGDARKHGLQTHSPLSAKAAVSTPSMSSSGCREPPLIRPDLSQLFCFLWKDFYSEPRILPTDLVLLENETFSQTFGSPSVGNTRRLSPQNQKSQLQLNKGRGWTFSLDGVTHSLFSAQNIVLHNSIHIYCYTYCTAAVGGLCSGSPADTVKRPRTKSSSTEWNEVVWFWFQADDFFFLTMLVTKENDVSSELKSLLRCLLMLGGYIC